MIHTHESSWISLVSPDFAVNKDMSLHENSDDFTVCQSILQSVSQNQNEWKTFPRFVWSGRGFWSLYIYHIQKLHQSSNKTSFKNRTKSKITLTLTKAPPNLSSIQCLGALSLFKCFFNPLACHIHI